MAKIITAAICAIVLVWLLWLLADILLTRVGTGSQTELTVQITVNGSEPRLEETLRALKRLCTSGRLPASLEMIDKGMDESTRHVAMLLARDGVGQLREYEWKKKESSQSPVV